MAKGKHAAALFEVIHKGKANEARAAEKSARAVVAREIATTPPITKSTSSASFNLDSDHHTISLTVSFVAAGTAASALLVLVVVAFLAGRRIGANGLPAVVETTEQLRQHPPHPTVLNIARQGSSQAQPAQSSPLLLTAASSDTASSAPQTVQQQPSVIGINPQRQGGLNYVIMQSYPEEKIANDARDALVAAGVGCTVEKWAGFGHGDWFSVIGTTGFDRIRGAQYDAYIQTIQTVGSKFAGTSRFKKFEPHAYKWK